MRLNRILIIIFALFLITQFQLKAQDQPDSIEVYIIDSFVTPELPHSFVLTFFTSEDCKSQVVIDNQYSYPVSNELTSSHKIKIDITDLKLSGKEVPFYVEVEDSLGNKYKSETYDFNLPYEVKVKGGSNFLLLCLFGGAVFALPNPVYVKMGDKNYFSLTKEIPIISFRGSSFNYASDYFSIEYSYIFNAENRKIFRIGYKHIFEIPGIQYISPGLNGFTNFDGFNGISPEISIGLFKIFDAFTVYTRYRFNFKPGSKNSEFHEISVGLYSSFFSIYL